MKAVWNGQILAQSNKTFLVEGNYYFPPDSVNTDFLKPSEHHTVCAWKGTASYFDIVVGESTNKQAAWYYPNPGDIAAYLKNYVAFWRGVEIIEEKNNEG